MCRCCWGQSLMDWELKKTVDDNPKQVELLEETEENIKDWQNDVTEPAIEMP